MANSIPLTTQAQNLLNTFGETACGSLTSDGESP